jgi:hypothetical protein
MSTRSGAFGFRVYSNIPVAGRFKADFVLIKPVPFAAAGGRVRGAQGAR